MTTKTDTKKHLRVANPTESAKSEKTPWGSIFLVAVVTGVGGALAVRGIESFFKFLERRKEPAKPERELPPPQQPMLTAQPQQMAFLPQAPPPPPIVYVAAPPSVPSSIPGAPQPVLAEQPYTVPPWLQQHLAEQGQRMKALEGEVASLRRERIHVVDDDEYYEEEAG